MVITKKPKIQSNIKLNIRSTNRKSSKIQYKKQITEIGTRIETAFNEFVKLKTIFCSKDFIIEQRVRTLS